jgi:uncharacterized protein (TIGR00369 family)
MLMDIWQQMLELEPFLRHIGIEAETLGPDQAILRLPVRREITNHTGAIHGGAQFALGEATGLTAAGLSLGVPLAHLLVLTAASTITYQRPSQGVLKGRANVLHEQREQLQASWKDRGRARVTVPVEIIDASGEIVTTLSVSCVLLPR